MLTFNTDNMVQQSFPFPAPIMDYIFKYISASQLLKLYKTCKFFYAKFRLNIIEDFELCEKQSEQRIVGNSMAIGLDNPAWSKLNNLWVSKSFTCCEYSVSELPLEPLELDYTKFSRMTYSLLVMLGESSVADFEFLVKPVTLQHLTIYGDVCYPGTEMSLSVEEIVERAPHVSTFDLSSGYFQPFLPIDMTKLLAYNRQTKLISLQICEISKIPDALLVIEFFKKHAIPNIDYFFGFDIEDDDYDIVNVKRFYKAVDDGIRAWKLSLELSPKISTSFISLTGKTAVITGASDGIGKAATILFRQLGATVIAVSRNQAQLKNLIVECQNIKNSGFLHIFWSPYMNENLIRFFFVRVNHKYDLKFDVLVNIADTFEWSGVPDIELETTHCNDLHINVEIHYYLLQEAKSYLKNSKGCIINIPYEDGLITRPDKALSIAERKNQIKNIEAELVSSGIRINAVNSSAPVSDLPRPAEMNDIVYKKYLKESKKLHDEQAANSIAFLASDSAKLITGSTLNINPMNSL